MVKSPLEQQFRALADGWVAGQRVEKGQVIELTAAQAKYEPVAPVADAPEKPARRRPAPEAAGA